MNPMKPMLCTTETVDNLRGYCGREWTIERKYDGIRATMVFENGKIRIFSRSGRDITENFPELIGGKSRTSAHSYHMVRPCKTHSGPEPNESEPMILDGEIVCFPDEEDHIAMSFSAPNSKENFEIVQSRIHTKGKSKIKLLSKLNPCVFVGFARMGFDGKFAIGPRIVIAPYFYVSTTIIKQMMKKALENDWEGFVLKKTGSRYEPGKRSPNWKKVKLFKEVEHTFTESEDNPKGLTLYNKIDNKRVAVLGSQADEVRRKLKNNGQVTVEVQYMDSANGEWRFPSFRGIVQ